MPGAGTPVPDDQLRVGSAMPENCTIVGTRLDYRGAHNCVLAFTGGEYAMEGDRDEWSSITSRSPDASIRFTTLVHREPMDEFSKLSLGMKTFFRGIETLHEANKSRILDTISRAAVFVGVVAEPGFAEQHLNAIYSMADELEGMVFDGHAMRDCEGVVLLDRDGGAEEE